MCVRVCVCGSSTRKILVCASSEDSRKSVRSLESALILADFYNFSNEIKVYFTLITCKVKKKKDTEYIKNVYENINLSFFEKKKSSDSVLKFSIAI